MAESAATNWFKTWLPIIANIATTVAMFVAAKQFYVASANLDVATRQSETAAKQFELSLKQQRFANAALFLKEGRDLEQQYFDGKATARDVVTFYYKIFSMDRDDLLVKEQAGPLLTSMEETVAADPRVKAYWAGENHKRYSEAFTTKMDSLINKGAPR